MQKKQSSQSFFSQNIKFLRKRKRRTQEDIAGYLQVKRSTLSGYENNVAQPGIEVLIKLSEYFNVAIDTLVKTDLSSLSESQLSQLERGYDVYIKGSNLRILTTTVNSDNEDNIELVNEKAKAGYQRGFADPEYINDLPVFHLPIITGKTKHRAFQISGDSMRPIPNKSWIVCEYVQDWFAVKNGEAYIILTLNDGIVFKIAENRLQKEHKLILHSLNKSYKPYSIPVDEIREIWKFKNFISHKIPEQNEEQLLISEKIEEMKTELDQLKKYINQK